MTSYCSPYEYSGACADGAYSQNNRCRFFGIRANARANRQQQNTPLAAPEKYAGYADQSHIGHAVRRGTGFSLAQLNRYINAKEALWCYRILGERFWSTDEAASVVCAHQFFQQSECCESYRVILIRGA
jgi:hypothetical protein